MNNTFLRLLLRNTAAVATVLAVLVLSIACANAPASLPVKYLIFVDESNSIRLETTTLWRPELKRMLKKLKPGDRIDVLRIFENTLAGGEICSPDVPAASRGADLVEMGLQKKKLVQAQAETLSCIVDALKDRPPITATDLFGAIDKTALETSNEYRMVVIILSDGLHSTVDLDLEKKRIKPEDIPGLVSLVGRRHEWTNHSLANVKVIFLLTDEKAATRVVNDRLVLRQLWSAIIVSLGGQLVNFDTQITGGLE